MKKSKMKKKIKRLKHDLRRLERKKAMYKNRAGSLEKILNSLDDDKRLDLIFKAVKKEI